MGQRKKIAALLNSFFGALRDVAAEPPVRCDVTAMQKRRLEKDLREAGFSWKDATAIVSVVSAWLAKEIEHPGSLRDVGACPDAQRIERMPVTVKPNNPRTSGTNFKE